MVRISNIAKSLALTLALVPLTFLAYGQEMKDAADLYNGAATTFQKSPAKAAADLEKCITFCEQINTDESNELMARAKTLLPRVHFQHAKLLFSKGNVNESIGAMEKARDAAEDIDDKQTVKAVDRTIPAIYYKQGLNEEADRNFAKAIELCQKAISCNNRFVDPYLVIAKCQDSLGQPEEMLETLEQGIEAAKRIANVQRQVDMRVIATNYLKASAAKEQQARKHSAVVELMKRALEFDDQDPMIYQTIVVSQAELGHHDDVISNADLALKNADNATNKAQLYFLKAKSYQAKGMKAEACAAYKNSAQGQFKEAAEHEMKDVLKCN